MTVCLLLLGLGAYAQTVTGEVYEINDDGEKQPIVGANIVWMGTAKGTVTDVEGKFSTEQPGEDHHKLIFSYVGYKNDTLCTQMNGYELSVELRSTEELDEVVVKGHKGETHVSTYAPTYQVTLDEGELEKAACCNLSEAFETTPDVDVVYNDAVTGAKQIRMLGLDGVYTQMLTENTPGIRGLATTYGLQYTPGPWVESIMVSKGTGSVVNGYESITGQINVQIKQPDDSERFYLNLFGNHLGRAELNYYMAKPFSKKVSSSLLLHGDYFGRRLDPNDDGFVDIPLLTTVSGMNRWKFRFTDKLMGQFNIKGLYEDRLGGQKDFQRSLPVMEQDNYGVLLTTKRFEGFTKLGYILNSTMNRSIGWTTQTTYHDQQGWYGKRRYTGEETNFNTNLIFQTYVSNPAHMLKAGASYMYDDFNEQFDSLDNSRTEHVPGVFAEYSYSLRDELKVVGGMRVDYHNLYGTFWSPRVHMRYSPLEVTSLRITAGKGYRVANVFAENTNVLISSRDIELADDLQPEVGWNFGASLTQKFELGGRPGTFVVDFYHTRFENQVVVDLDQDSDKVYFYNLDGRSFSNSMQVELIYDIVKGFEVKAAYKLNDTRTTYNGTLRRMLFMPMHHGLLSLNYETPNQLWMFDATVQLQGKGRLPLNYAGSDDRLNNGFSPIFPMLSAQITKRWKNIEVYVGGENLTGFTQDDPILGANAPFSENFDASSVWAPVFGQRVYAGLRLKFR